MIPDDDELVAWARSLPPDVTEDTLWRTPAYRLALFLSDQAMDDVRYLVRDIRTRGHIPQLLDALLSARLARLTRVVKILTAIIPRERDRAPRRRRRGEDDAHQR